jgi:hypothetical protein
MVDEGRRVAEMELTSKDIYIPKGKDRRSVRVRRKLDVNDHDGQSPWRSVH